MHCTVEHGLPASSMMESAMTPVACHSAKRVLHVPVDPVMSAKAGVVYPSLPETSVICRVFFLYPLAS